MFAVDWAVAAFVSAVEELVLAVLAVVCAVPALVLAVFAVDCAAAALVIPVDALVLAVLAVDVTPAAAVCMVDAVLPVDVVPVNADTRLSHVDCTLDAALLSAVPTAAADAAPAAEIAEVH